MKRRVTILLVLIMITTACAGVRGWPESPVEETGRTVSSSTFSLTPSGTYQSNTAGPVPDVESEVYPVRALQPGQRARAHLEALSQEIGGRVTNTAGESQSAKYIENEFKKMGYVPETQIFTLKNEDGSLLGHSANIIAVKKGQSEQKIVIGAHFDSVDVGRGADDNASGIAVLLEAAERVKDVSTPYSLYFVAFGSEEAGMLGSQYYVSQMNSTDIAAMIAMINLDSLAVGNNTYVYGSTGKAGRLRDWTLERAKKEGFDLRGESGFTSDSSDDFSDHAAFSPGGYPFCLF